jgi:cellulose synthase/poly-beta-1,6-N-acetylglucosamine synthase-like glycosyltransferase
MMILIYILAILTILYCSVLLRILTGLARVPAPKSSEQPTVSVVVAARNEENNIDDYEIIIVDDNSEDRTVDKVSQFQSSSPHRLLLLQTKNRAKVVSPKKNALHLGIKNAVGEIILLTDADCQPPPKWISGTVAYFEPTVGLVVGFSPYELPALDSLWASFLALDSLSLGAVAAGTSGFGSPATCNGRNLAYRKCVFEQVGGFEKIKQFVSGDDDLFLKLVVRNTHWQTRFAYSADLAVPTKVLNSWRQFVHQRLRHASKGFYYEPRQIAVLSILYLYNFLLFITLPWTLIFGSFFMTLLFYLIL